MECPRCIQDRPSGSFRVVQFIRKSGVVVFKKHCRFCENTRLHILARAKGLRNRDWLDSYKVVHGCAVCGEREPRCLEFHHLVRRLSLQKKMSHMVRGSYSVARLQSEIDGCALLCVNCHRKVHLCLDEICVLSGRPDLSHTCRRA